MERPLHWLLAVASGSCNLLGRRRVALHGSAAAVHEYVHLQELRGEFELMLQCLLEGMLEGMLEDNVLWWGRRLFCMPSILWSDVRSELVEVDVEVAEVVSFAAFAFRCRCPGCRSNRVFISPGDFIDAQGVTEDLCGIEKSLMAQLVDVLHSGIV